MDALAALLIAVCLAALSGSPAHCQWLETGPYTSTSTVASTPGNLTSSDLVYGMPAQVNPVYGAANAILQSPIDANTYWALMTSGGIWKTTNGGVTWVPTTDHQSSLSIGAITIDTADPTGKTMYAATGDYSAGLFHYSPQTTLLKSTDGGNSWTEITPSGIQNLFRLASGPTMTDPTPASIRNIIAMGNVILVGAGGSTGSFFNSGGLYRSTDGGATFSLVPGFETEVSSLFSTSVNNQTVLIAARNGRSDHGLSAILYSADQGATWTTLLGPNTPLLATNSANPNNVLFNNTNWDNFNIKAAAGPGGSLFVAVAKDTNSQQIGLFYTPQFTPGSPTQPTWYNLGEPQLIAASGKCAQPSPCSLEGNKQAGLHFALIADPTQTGVAYIAGSGQFGLTGLGGHDEIATIVRVNYNATTNAATYTPIAFPGGSSSPHADTRALTFDSRGNLLAIDDGGIYALSNPQATGTWTAFGGVAAGGSPLRAIEAYSAVMDTNTGRLAFASQDNGAGLSAPTATMAQIKPGAAWQNVLGGDGFSVAVNSKTGGPAIFYATNDDNTLARSFANENLSSASPPNLLTIKVAGSNAADFFSYQNDGANGIVVAVNAVDPTKLIFRSSRLYTWTDPGTALTGSINITDISGTNIFSANAWSEKVAYGTQDAPDAVLAGGPRPVCANCAAKYDVFLRTQEQVNAGNTTIDQSNRLTSFPAANGDPVSVLFDPATEHKFFIADTLNVYATKDTGQTLATLVVPANLNFQNPTSLAYIADGTGAANNGVRALLVGGKLTTAGNQGGIISTLDPFATSVQWTNLGLGLPNAAVFDLRYYPDIDTLVAATYGRGVFILYDVTSHYSTATALWFGKANNDSTPDPSLLTGNRPLDKFGTGTLTLTGPATYSGGTFVLGGTLAVGSDAALGDPSGQIAIDSATWAVTSSFSTARTVTFGPDGGTVDVGAFALTASGLWAAQGTVNKTGSGLLALQGLNLFQDFMVSGGTLQVDGSFSGTSLQVAMGAALTGTGQIAAPTTVSGILAPGDAPGILTFTAPVTLTPSSNLRITIDGATAGNGAGFYSQIIVNGASLTLGGTLSPIFRGINGANNNFTPVLGQQFTIAAASGGVIGQFAGVDLTSTGLPSSLRFDTLYGATVVNLVTTPSSYSVNAFGPAWNANQQSVGAALDFLRPPAGTTSSNTTLQNAFNALYGLSATQIGSALTGLSGEGEARAVANTLDTVDALHIALLDHLIGAPVAPGFNNLSMNFDGGGSARNFYAAYNRIPGDRSASAEKAPSSAAVEPNHWWSSVFYQANMTDTSAGIAGGTSNVSGFIAGVEGEIRPGLLVGGAISSAHTDASGSSSGTGDNIAFVAYGRQTVGRLQAAAYAGYVRNSFGLQHDFGSLGGGAPLKSSGASSLIAGGALAYTFNAGAFQIAPTLTASFTHMLFDGINVTSPQGFAVALPSQWTDRFRLTLGPTVTRSLTTDRGIKLVAAVSGGFLYQTNPVTALDGQLFGIPTLAQSAPAGHAGGFADVGLNASFTDKLTGFIRWRGEAREQARSYQLTGGLTATF